MARKRFTAEQIIIKLREAEVGLAQGKPPETPASNGISDPTGAKRLKRPYDSSAGCTIVPDCVKSHRDGLPAYYWR